MKMLQKDYQKALLTGRLGTQTSEVRLVKDVFYPPQPYSKWILDETKWVWKAPVDYPDDGKRYIWNDNTGAWEEVTE